MNNYDTNEYYTEEQLQQPYESPQPVPLSIVFPLLFVFGAISVATLHGFNYAVIGLGVLTVIVFIMSSINDGFKIAPELKYFAGFILWGALGIFMVEYLALYISKLRTLIQLFVMVLLLSYYAKNVRSTKWLLISVLLGIAIISIAAIYSGDFARAEIDGEQARLGGITGNSNAFSIAIAYATLIVLYLFRTTRSLVVKVAMVALLFLFARFIIASGSRKGFIGFILIMSSWTFFSYRKEFFKRPHVAIVAIMAIFAVGAYSFVRLQDSVMMNRFIRGGEELTDSAAEGSVGLRKTMIQSGIEITLSNPIMGVGFDHFRIRSLMGMYSHNNYVEVFSNTGVPGGLLYYMVYIVLLVRLIKLSKFDLTFNEKEMLDIAKVYLLVRVVLDIVVVSYYTKIDWIMFSIFIGFTFNLQNELKGRGVRDMVNEQYLEE